MGHGTRTRETQQSHASVTSPTVRVGAAGRAACGPGPRSSVRELAGLDMKEPPGPGKHRTHVIRRRIRLSLAVVVALSVLAFSAAGVVISLEIGAANADAALTSRIQATEADVGAAVDAQRDALRLYVINGSADLVQAYHQGVDAEQAALQKLIGLAAGDERLVAATSALDSSSAAWRAGRAEPAIALVDRGAKAAAQNTMGDSYELQLLGSVDSSRMILTSVVQTREQATRDGAAALSTTIVAMLVAVGLMIIVAVLVVGRWFTRSISDPLDHLMITAEAVTSGHDAEFKAERDDEVGMLAGTLEGLRRSVEQRLEETRSNASRAQTFNVLSERIAFASGEEDILEGAMIALDRLLSPARGDFLLLNPSQDRLFVAAAWGSGALPRGTPINVDRPDKCPGIRHGFPYLVADVQDGMAVQCVVHRAESGSLLCVPMLAVGQTVGVIHLQQPPDRPIDAGAIRLASRVAEQAALALANTRLMRTLEGQAMTDALTGLHNARFFDPYLERELLASARDRHPLGVIMIDLDRFKVFNDTYGHPAGDQALKAFAITVESSLRASDLVARYGGEEFVVAVRGADLAATIAVAEKIRKSVERLVVDLGPGRRAKLTASFGVASSPVHGTDRLVLLRTADDALYQAKQQGRNRVAVPWSAAAHTPAIEQRPPAPEVVSDEPAPRDDNRGETEHPAA